MNKHYEYINGHTVLTKNSPEAQNQFLSGLIIDQRVCKNCGASGAEIYEKECISKEFQALDEMVDYVLLQIERADKKSKRLNYKIKSFRGK